jgi:hypothetical protein
MPLNQYIVEIHPLALHRQQLYRNRIEYFYLPIWAHMGKKKKEYIYIEIEFLN